MPREPEERCRMSVLGDAGCHLVEGTTIHNGVNQNWGFRVPDSALCSALQIRGLINEPQVIDAVESVEHAVVVKDALDIGKRSVDAAFLLPTSAIH